MQVTRYRAVSKSTTAREELTTVWQPQNGKFDDGITIVHLNPGMKPDKFGPYIKSVMNEMGVTEEEVATNLCLGCGQPHEGRSRRCAACLKKRAERIDS